jgi:hypothetical protein
MRTADQVCMDPIYRTNSKHRRTVRLVVQAICVISHVPAAEEVGYLLENLICIEEEIV